MIVNYNNHNVTNIFMDTIDAMQKSLLIYNLYRVKFNQ